MSLLHIAINSPTRCQTVAYSLAEFIVSPYGKAITLIAIVLCGMSYMYSCRPRGVTARIIFGAALVIGAANIWAYIKSVG